MTRLLKTPAFALMVIGSVLIALSVLRFVLPEPVTSPGVLANRADNFIPFQLHVLLGGSALLIGPLQFVRRLRTRRPGLHRLVGVTYASACLVSGVAGFVVALSSRYGPVAQSGFAALAVLWVAATAYGWSLAVQRRFAEHERWMIRSFALTFAAVTLRLMLPLSASLGLAFEVAYPAIAWLCWTVNLAAVEAAFRLRGRSFGHQAPAPA